MKRSCMFSLSLMVCCSLKCCMHEYRAGKKKKKKKEEKVLSQEKEGRGTRSCMNWSAAA